MKLKNLRSMVTVQMSEEHSTPRPPAPFAQCSTVPPGKWPPQQINVTSGNSGRVSPSQSLIAGRPHDPVAIGGVKMDRHVAERVAPLDHGCVKVWMRDADRGNPAEPLDQRDGRGVEHCDRVPQHVPMPRAHEQRALADGEMRLGADAEDARLILVIGVAVTHRERVERGPCLPTRWYVLALLLANRAVRRRCVTRRILCAAGGADECGHFGPRQF